ncbi:uncharacterized protein [Physcomitrium patens]|uniref:TF-B3 domain-containing protein n=2 Tax=Physcomitrium patens TaxID=3218 RepID=A0A7I4EJS9_PHYPA|nr:B3 domain-containing protein Os03g0622100-like [Physcomitrium patens]|eukprot:XP_024383740.1 B3 domain-containing protein Os03g0622100-like [Physcomitrella patens]
MKKQACADCLAHCERVHGRGGETSDAIPFLSPSFLRRIGLDSTECMPIPSSFVKANIKTLGTSLTIEGPSTDKWTVAVEGSFAKHNISLRLGWVNFVKDHHLQLGDQLLFTLKTDSYFQVEIFDESGCKKLSALDAVNSLKPIDSNVSNQEPNRITSEFEAKPVDLEPDKMSRKAHGAGGSNRFQDASPPARLSGRKQRGRSEVGKENTSSKKACIDPDSPESEGGNPIAAGDDDEVLKQRGSRKVSRGKSRKSQDFYEDVDEEDFTLFHKPRARNTPARNYKASSSTAEANGQDVKKSSSAAKEKQKASVLCSVAAYSSVVKPRVALLHEKVGHGMMRCQFVIDGSLDDPAKVLEVS